LETAKTRREFKFPHFTALSSGKISNGNISNLKNKRRVFRTILRKRKNEIFFVGFPILDR
jgi:hypothetical protein